MMAVGWKVPSFPSLSRPPYELFREQGFPAVALSPFGQICLSGVHVLDLRLGSIILLLEPDAVAIPDHQGQRQQ